jgi:hypothetical protein
MSTKTLTNCFGEYVTARWGCYYGTEIILEYDADHAGE